MFSIYPDSPLVKPQAAYIDVVGVSDLLLLLISIHIKIDANRKVYIFPLTIQECTIQYQGAPSDGCYHLSREYPGVQCSYSLSCLILITFLQSLPFTLSLKPF